MRRIVKRLQNAQVLASVAVIVVALMTFGLIAVVGGTHRQHVRTNEMLDALHAEVIQIGAIHSSVVATNTVVDAQVLAIRRIRQDVTADLRALEPRFDDAAVFERLESQYMAYIDAVDALIVAARAGDLPQAGDFEKARAANALFEHAAAIGGAREYLSAQSASAWNTARVGFAGAIMFLVVSVLAITRVTERKLGRALLDEERSRLERERTREFSALVEHSTDAIIVLDTTGRIRYTSQGIEQILGQPADSVVGVHLYDLLHPDDLTANEQTRLAFIANGSDSQAVTSTVRVRRADGEWTWIEAVATNRHDVPGIEGIVINARDITERRQVEAQLRFHALHDALTGLVNRTTFTAHVGNALRRARRAGASFAVMFVDLDNFKYINDTWGHAIGDDLLIGVADRLRDVLRDCDTAARQGGDEFVLLIEDIDSAGQAVAVAERIHAALDRPFTIDGQAHSTAASIGVHIVDGTEDATVADILRFADIAMYRAKRDGRDRTVVYSALGVDGDERASA
jgi:diguanylate cyclase (GGDEF)-like protein/PAS domain S-box-containing protein